MTARILERLAAQQNTFGFDVEANKLFMQGISDPTSLSVEERSRGWSLEACATAYHWAPMATTRVHQLKIIPAIAVAPFRQGHKTDKNDALAAAEAANRPDIKTAPMKSIDHQSIQSIQGLTELIIQERTARSTIFAAYCWSSAS